MGSGALLIFVGVALFSSRLVVPLARVARLAGDADRRRGGIARARQRRRNPQRTASTASALMIGLALVTLVAMLAAGITASSTAPWTTSRPASSTRSPRRTTSRRSRSSAANAAAKTPGVESVASVRAGDALVFGNTTDAHGRRLRRRQGDQPQVEGRARRPSCRSSARTARSSTTATRRTTTSTVGSPFPLLTPTGKTLDLT